MLLRALGFSGLLLLSACSHPSQASLEPRALANDSSHYPPTRRVFQVDEYFGAKVEDPYQWLENGKDSDVQTWMKEQDSFARSQLESLPQRAELKKRLQEVLYFDSVGTPIKRGERYFYSRKKATLEKSVIYWREGLTGSEQPLLDPNEMSKEGKNVSLGTWKVSWDGSKVVYAQKENNSDESTLYTKDVESGTVSPIDVITGAKYADPAWNAEGTGFYYTWIPSDPSIPTAERPGHQEIRYHPLGQAPEKDPTVLPKTGNPKIFIGAQLGKEGRYLFATHQHGWNRSDVFVQDLQNPQAGFKPVFVGKDAIASIEYHEGRFYLFTNEGAPNWKVLVAEATQLDSLQWKTLIPERKDTVIESASLVGGRMGLTILRNAAHEIELWSLKGRFEKKIRFPQIGSSTGLVGDADQADAFYSFSSFIVPTRIYHYRFDSGKSQLWGQTELPFDPAPYEVKQEWYKSKDGTKVSIFILHKKGLKKNGKNPFLLYGYGGFSVNMLPGFSASLIPWLEKGGSYALPNLRGGAEYGENWHRSGYQDKKQNVFDDFIAAAEHLIAKQYTSPAQLAIRGGSNGGLLVGAVMTQRPELFGAVICAVPLLDMLRYHLFGSGRTWIEEYGSSETLAGFKTLYAYSPYHRVQKGATYPPTLIDTSDTDDRVDPLHARKMAAALQWATDGKTPVLLRIEKNAGHGGADLVKQTVDKMVDTYSFLLEQLKVN